jgi:hypothetical protein
MIEAAADLRDVPSGDLYEQFVGWFPHDPGDFEGL